MLPERQPRGCSHPRHPQVPSHPGSSASGGLCALPRTWVAAVPSFWTPLSQTARLHPYLQSTQVSPPGTVFLDLHPLTTILSYNLQITLLCVTCLGFSRTVASYGHLTAAASPPTGCHDQASHHGGCPAPRSQQVPVPWRPSLLHRWPPARCALPWGKGSPLTRC